jgi:hypothetical protein
MPSVRASRTVPVPPERAAELWTNVSRWPTFVEGYAHALQKDGSWPAEGAKLVWESTPGGRGRVTERVLSLGPGHIATQLLEESLSGTQTVSFRSAEEGATLLEMTLEYELNPTTIWRRGPVGKLADALFIRRALADSLERTLRRFATEAVEEAAL